MRGVLTEQESTFKRLRSQGLLEVTFEPLDGVCEFSEHVCLCVLSVGRVETAACRTMWNSFNRRAEEAQCVYGT